MRLLVTFTILFFNLGGEKDFNQMYVVEEDTLTGNLIENYGLAPQPDNNRSTIQALEGFEIIVDGEMVSKINNKGAKERSYVVIVKNEEGKMISTVQKTYQEFANFQSALEYNLRPTGVKAPDLGNPGQSNPTILSSDGIFQ